MRRKHKINKTGKLHITNGNCYAASRRLGFHKTPVGLAPFVVFCSSTFFCARGTTT